MGKKKLGSLMDGILGNNETVDANSKDKPITKRGRPKNPNAIPVIKSSYSINPETLKKLKYISLMEDKLLKDVTEEAYASYIQQWENKNGKINLIQK